MRRGLLIGAVLVVVALAAGGALLAGVLAAKRPILVGILHSQTGPLAASERAMIDGELLAIEEINAKGGLLGRPVRAVSVDGRSQEAVFAQQAQRLISIEHASVIFGVAASYCRKAVKPVVEENDHLLFYPAAFEGAEVSPNIVYTGGPANQQVSPAVSWCVDTLKAKKFFLVGSDSVGPRVLGALAGDQIKARGAQVVGEEYVLHGTVDVAGPIAKIKEAAPDVVLSSLEGETNAPFYQGLRRAGLGPDRTRVVSFSVGEQELRTLPISDLVGSYAAWNYFQSIERDENAAFVRRFKAKYGRDAVISDGAVTAYNSVLLWAQAVAEAGTDEVGAVRKAIRRQSLDGAEGIVSVDSRNLHGWRPFFLGKVRPDGQFDVVFTLPKPINPVPFPSSRPRSAWLALLDDLSARWGGRWINPARPAPATH